ncbi:MAG TPA: response regulator [Bacteroidales bacterium]|nr:response regulator [Bacteroidales bacterium]
MDLKQREILIIDDDITNIQILQKILEKEGYLTKSTSKPEEAIKYIKSDYPDLVLMDIGLEGTNGFELTSAIKSDPNNAYLPIIFITGQRDKDYILKAYKTGAVDYIVKPIEKETLLARIETHLKISSLYRELLSKNEEIAAINEEYSAVNEEYFAINEELTETNQKLQKLYNEAENREELLKTTMNSISWGIISSDLNGIVTNVN